MVATGYGLYRVISDDVSSDGGQDMSPAVVASKSFAFDDRHEGYNAFDDHYEGHLRRPSREGGRHRRNQAPS